jgi:hypothetical protein
MKNTEDIILVVVATVAIGGGIFSLACLIRAVGEIASLSITFLRP